MKEPPSQLKRTRSGNMKDPPPKPTYRCVKTSLKSVVKNNLVMDKLGAAALRANSIIIHTLQLLKLYLLHCCEKGVELPKLNRQFVTSVMKVLCKPPSKGKPPSAETQSIKDTLKPFYEQHYKAYVSEELSYEHMSRLVIEAKKGSSETYIDEVVDYEPLKGKKLVAIDPNMSDLLYCVDGATKEQTRLRYTQDTRRKETKAKKYRDYAQECKQEVIDGKRVVEWEAELSAYSRKTTDFERFKAYVEKKNEITEARLLKRFEKLFGSGADTIVAIGDWGQRQHRRFNEPVKGKGFRTMFRKVGYDVYLVDEFRTSSRCSAREQGECKTFRDCKNPRPYRSGLSDLAQSPVNQENMRPRERNAALLRVATALWWLCLCLIAASARAQPTSATTAQYLRMQWAETDIVRVTFAEPYLKDAMETYFEASDVNVVDIREPSFPADLEPATRSTFRLLFMITRDPATLSTAANSTQGDFQPDALAAFLQSSLPSLQTPTEPSLNEIGSSISSSSGDSVASATVNQTTTSLVPFFPASSVSFETVSTADAQALGPFPALAPAGGDVPDVSRFLKLTSIADIYAAGPPEVPANTVLQVEQSYYLVLRGQYQNLTLEARETLANLLLYGDPAREIDDFENNDGFFATTRASMFLDYIMPAQAQASASDRSSSSSGVTTTTLEISMMEALFSYAFSSITIGQFPPGNPPAPAPATPSTVIPGVSTDVLASKMRKRQRFLYNATTFASNSASSQFPASVTYPSSTSVIQANATSSCTMVSGFCTYIYWKNSVPALGDVILDAFQDEAIGEQISLSSAIDACHSSLNVNQPEWRKLVNASACFSNYSCPISMQMLVPSAANLVGKWRTRPEQKIQKLLYQQQQGESLLPDLQIPLELVLNSEIVKTDSSSVGDPRELELKLRRLLEYADISVEVEFDRIDSASGLRTIQWGIVYDRWVGSLPRFIPDASSSMWTLFTYPSPQQDLYLEVLNKTALTSDDTLTDGSNLTSIPV